MLDNGTLDEMIACWNCWTERHHKHKLHVSLSAPGFVCLNMIFIKTSTTLRCRSKENKLQSVWAFVIDSEKELPHEMRVMG